MLKAFKAVIFWAVLSVVVVGLMADLNLDFHAYELTIATVVVGCIVVSAFVVRDHPHLMIVSVFTVVVSVFHFGLLFSKLGGIDLSVAFGSTFRWYDGDSPSRQALWASLLFVLGMTFATAFASRLGHQGSDQRKRLNLQLTRRKQAITNVLLLLLVSFWIVSIIGILGISNYNEYNFVLRNSGAGLLPTALNLSYPVISALFFFGAIWSRDWRPAFAIFALWAFVAFPLGLRGEVLFPAAMTVTTLHVQGRIHLRWSWSLAGSYAILAISYFIRLARLDASTDQALSGASGFYGLAELGGSLRPVREVSDWLSGGIDHLRWGATYFAPVERTLALVIPFLHRVPAELDDRLMNVVLAYRTHGSYGFSIVAEALINFGYLGCLIIGFLVGQFLTAYGRSVVAGRLGVINSAVFYALYYHVRQSFVGAYGSFILFALTGLFILVLANGGFGRRKAELSRPRVRPPIGSEGP